MPDRPYTVEVSVPSEILSRYDNHIVRRLSALQGQFADEDAYRERLGREDEILYEVYELTRPMAAGEILHGLSIVRPGKIGDEYFMTKGHFHTVPDTAEVYFCLKGQGMMVMESLEGDWAVEPLDPHRLLYVPPRWAHRSVNTGSEGSLVTFFAYPGNAGHDYGSIERQGFRKIVVERNGKPAVVDNPRWRPPEGRA